MSKSMVRFENIPPLDEEIRRAIEIINDSGLARYMFVCEITEKLHYGLSCRTPFEEHPMILCNEEAIYSLNDYYAADEDSYCIPVTYDMYATADNKRYFQCCEERAKQLDPDSFQRKPLELLADPIYKDIIVIIAHHDGNLTHILIVYDGCYFVAPYICGEEYVHPTNDAKISESECIIRRGSVETDSEDSQASMNNYTLTITNDLITMRRKDSCTEYVPIGATIIKAEKEFDVEEDRILAF